MAEMNELFGVVRDIMTRLDFPQEAQCSLLSALESISSDKTAAAWFCCILGQYEESMNCQYKQMLAETKALGAALGIHEYTVSMLLFLCMTKKLKSRYDERGISEEVFYNSMMDIKYKLTECNLVYGVDGSFVGSWFPGFFDMTRFAFGRLQCEIISLPTEYRFDTMTIPAGTKMINVHIPRTGTRLDHDEALKSYEAAAQMFAPLFGNAPTVFTCHSWLLDPWIKTVLSPRSNIVRFCEDYFILKTGEYKDYSEMWRLFDCLCTGDPSALPQDSSLRRAYVERMKRGETLAWGRGVFVYEDGEIINSTEAIYSALAAQTA